MVKLEATRMMVKMPARRVSRWAPGGGHNGAGVLNARLAKLVVPDSAQHDLVGRAMNLPTPTDRRC